MVKLIGNNKILTAVFVSGRGSNLKAIHKYSKKKNSKINLKLVVSNIPKAKGINYAKKNKIKIKIVSYKNKINAEKQIAESLEANNIQLICLAGFMKILSKNFVKRFKNRILNIHPSLLPKYKGLNTHERAIKNKEKFSGCTVHFVNEKLDSGKIILQKKIKLLKSDSSRTLAKRVLKLENKLYPKAIIKVLSKI
tara:strand:+ start:112 stop:696 length:585 start_codon:yes stop_codon:yes gene_type:complete